MIRILQLEDDPRDAELVAYELGKLEQEIDIRRVFTREAFEEALASDRPDIILTDHRIPGFAGRDALKMARELAPGVPVILITGTLDDKMAVSYLKAGASDYILKDHLARLPTAVESALVEAEQGRQLDWQRSLLRAVLTSAPSLITAEDPEGRIVLANPAVAEAYGVPLEQLEGRDGSTLGLPPDEVARRAARRREVLRTHRASVESEEPITHVSNGTRRWFQVARKPLSTSRAGETLVLSVATDITERKRLFEAIPDALLQVGPSGRIERTNEAAERLFGLPRSRIEGRRVDDLLPRLAPRSRDSEPAERETEALPSRDLTVESSDGREVDVEVHSNAVELGGERRTILLISDVSARRQLEKQLHLASRLESVGRLAGGVSHDFNNLLMVIMTQAEILLRQAVLDGEVREGLTQIADAARRGGELTRQLLAFSRRQVLRPRILDLNKTVSAMHNLLPRVLGEDVELVHRLDPELGTVRADPAQLEQVIMNLVVNARDAMPSGGVLRIETANEGIENGADDRRRPMPAGRYVRLSVEDEGTGMSEETQAHIFEPFFTTKGEAGSGLGLATVYGIVKQSEGFVWVESAPGRGTRFDIFLPRLDEVESEEAVKPSPPPPGRGEETILVVEDELRLRGLVRRVLESYGYRVLEAESCAEARRVAAESTEPIHLVFTDVVLTDGTGTTLADELRRDHPQVAVLLTSGYPGEALASRGALDLEIHFLQKPYAPPVLARRIRSVLDAAGSGPSQGD